MKLAINVGVALLVITFILWYSLTVLKEMCLQATVKQMSVVVHPNYDQEEENALLIEIRTT